MLTRNITFRILDRKIISAGFKPLKPPFKSGLDVLVVRGFPLLNNQLFFATSLLGEITLMVKQIKMS